GPGEVRSEQVFDNGKHYITIANPESGEGFSGQHGPATLFVFDEASIVRDLLYENAKKQARHIVALSNPRTLGGWFRNAFPLDDPDKTQTINTPFGRRRLVTVGGKDCINVKQKRLEKPIGPLGGIDIRGRHFEMG